MSSGHAVALRRAQARWAKRARDVSRMPWVPWSLVCLLTIVVVVQSWTAPGDALTRPKNAPVQAQRAGYPHPEHAEQHAEQHAPGKKLMCILQPILSRDRDWNETNLQEHIGYKAFLTSFAKSIDHTDSDANVAFRVYYGYDVTDKVFGSHTLRQQFLALAEEAVQGSDVEFRLIPLYGLHGRITAIWNMMAKDAHAAGCDYHLMSNDDMLIFTKGWAGTAIRAMEAMPCPNFGIVRFVDEWASWATFTFHISSSLHMDIFNGVYYPVPYDTTHNDKWIHYTYDGFNSSKLLNLHVRNRVKDDLTLGEAPPRYKYDSTDGIKEWVIAGRAHVLTWYKSMGKKSCPVPLRTPRVRAYDTFEIL